MSYFVLVWNRENLDYLMKIILKTQKLKIKLKMENYTIMF